MNSLTLTYAGTEKFLADWGYANPVMKLVSQAASTFTVQCPGGDPAANTEDIPNWGVVTIRMNRTFSGSFSGGTIIFVGRRTDFGRKANPAGPGTVREFSDPWYDLTQTVFQHYWKEWNGSAFVNFYFSRLNMFQDITAGPGVPWTYLTTYGQLLEIIAYAGTTCGCNLQAGTIDPTWTVPSYAVKAITCAEAIITCLKPMADVVTYFDYTTTPPKLHIRQRGELGSQTLPFAGTDVHGRAHQSSDIKSREDLQPKCVCIQYQTNTVIDEKTYLNFTNEIYPGDGAPQAMGALVVPIDLRGSVTQNVKGQVTSVACDPTSLGFWTAHKKELGDTARITSLALVNSAINDGSTQCITIKDEQGNNVSLSDYPNEQVGQGDVASWMKAGSTAIVAKKVTITGYLKYGQKNLKKTTDLPHQIEAHQVAISIKLTNSAPNGVDGGGRPLPVKYSAIKSYTQGDPAIIGLAQNVYDSLSQLQWEGSHTVIEQSAIFAILSPALNLNLSGGATAWATMNAAVYSVLIDFTSCRSEVSFGPHKHLTAGEFLEYLLMWRQRQVFNNPSLRSDGKTNDSNDVQMPEHQPVDDTTDAPPEFSTQTIAAPQADISGVAQPHAEIQLDATTLVDSGPIMGALPPDQRIMKPRKLQLCINGSVMYGAIISGPPMTS